MNINWRRCETRGPGSNRALRVAALFVAAFGVYEANLRPVASWDSIPAALLPFSILLDGSVRLDRFAGWLTVQASGPPYFLHQHGQHWYSSYPIAQPLLLTPLYVPLLAVIRAGSWPVSDLVLKARVLEKLLAGALAAATVVVFYVLTAARRGAWLLTLAFAFGASTWSTSSQALWQHTGGVLLLLLATLLLARWYESKRHLLLAGVCAGLALLVRPTNALFAASVLAVLLGRRQSLRSVVLFAAPPLVCSALAAAYNWWLFGDARGGPYAAPLQLDVLPALAGLLFSPGRGLFVYCPFLLAAAAGVARFRTRADDAMSLLVPLSLCFSLAHLAAISVWPMWWGGFSWGPRLLTEITPFLLLLMMPAMDWIGSRRPIAVAFALALAWSVALQFVGAFFYPRGLWDSTPVEVAAQPSRLWDWKDNPVARTIAGGMVLEPHRIVLEGVMHGKAAALAKMKASKMRGF